MSCARSAGDQGSCWYGMSWVICRRHKVTCDGRECYPWTVGCVVPFAESRQLRPTHSVEHPRRPASRNEAGRLGQSSSLQKKKLIGPSNVQATPPGPELAKVRGNGLETDLEKMHENGFAKEHDKIHGREVEKYPEREVEKCRGRELEKCHARELEKGLGKELESRLGTDFESRGAKDFATAPGKEREKPQQTLERAAPALDLARPSRLQAPSLALV